MLKRILDPYKVFISLLIAAAFWLAPVGTSVEPTPVAGQIEPLQEFSDIPKLVLAIVPEVSADCAAKCKEPVCLKWVPIGGSCQPTNPWDIGCCTIWGTVCNEDLPGCGPDEPPPPPLYLPPTVSASLYCTTWGNSSWCINNGNIAITAVDPQNFAVTINGNVTVGSVSTPFSCASPCNLSMPSGSGAVTYTATAATSGLSSAAGNTAFKFDPGDPVITSSTSGAHSGSWYNTAGAIVTVLSSDAVSGLASVSITRNGTAVTSPFSLADGTHAVSVIAMDVAGNQYTSSFTVKMDSVKPIISFSTTGLLSGAWYRSATVAVAATDATSGMQTLLITDNGFSKSSPISLFDGTHTIFATASDNAGNVQAASYNLQVDGTPPTIVPNITGTAGLASWWVSTVDINASFSDAVSGIASQLFSPNGGTSWAALPYSISTDGIHQIVFRSTDNAGNLTEKNDTVKIDQSAPVLSVSNTGTLGENGWYVSTVLVSATASDATSGLASFRYNLNGVWKTYIDPFILGNGLHTIQFQASDNAGNIKTTPSQIFRVDTNAPIIVPTVTGTSGLNEWYISDAQVSASATDAVSGLEPLKVAVDGNALQVYTAPISLSDGLHTIQFQSTDIAGNLSTMSVSAKVDTVPPAQALVLNGTSGLKNWYVSNVLGTITTSDATSGNVITTITDNNDPAQSSPITLTEGIHNLQVVSVDEAGNSVSTSAGLSVDTTAPTTVFSSPAPNSVGIGTVQIGGQSTDMTSGLSINQISFDNLNWLSLPLSNSDWSYVWETADLPNGALSIFARSIDQAGNTGIPTQVNVVLDNHPPYLELSQFWNIWESGALSVKANVTPLKNVRIVIRDPFMRYPNELFFDDMPAPKQITWDRIIGSVTAPPGSYSVEVEACDIYGVCSKATGTIIVPEGIPTPTPELFVFPPLITKPPVIAPTHIVIPVQLPQAVVIPPETTPPIVVPPLKPVWPAAIAAMLLFMFAIVLSFDPRPAALRSLAKTIYPTIRRVDHDH